MLVNLRMRLGQHTDALAEVERAIAVFDEVTDALGHAYATDHLGMAHANLGDADAAIEHHTRALAGYRALGSVRPGGGLVPGTVGRDRARTASPHEPCSWLVG